MKKKYKIFKILTPFFIAAFLLNSTAYPYNNIPSATLSPDMVSGSVPLTRTGEARKLSLEELGKNIGALDIIANYFLIEGHAAAGLYDYLNQVMVKRTDEVRGWFDTVQLDLKSVKYKSIKREVTARFSFEGRNYKAVIKPAEGGAGKYTYQFRDITNDSKDFKGKEAPPANPFLQQAIFDGKVAKIYYDLSSGKVKIKRMRFVEGYRAGTVPRNMYLGEEIDPKLVFTRTETKSLKNWIKNHIARGEPASINIILGETVINWAEEAGKMNIAHAGVSDRSVYTGEIFLKKALQSEDLMDMVFNNDEYRHLLGKKHVAEEERNRQLDRIREEMNELEAIKIAMGDKNPAPDLLKERMERYLDTDNAGKMKDMIDLFNSVYLSQPLYPVESLYPMKKAIALMDKKYQEKLLKMIKKYKWDRNGSIAVNEIQILLDDMDAAKDWIKRFAPELRGRTIWEVSPEIWHEAGGLARVMQYHGVGIKELIKNADVRLCDLEPMYQYRIGPEGNMQPLSYIPSDKKGTEVITHPLKDLKLVDHFTVDLNGETINAEVFRGVNEFGIEVYLLKDVDENVNSFFTHSLYNYRKPDWNNPEDKITGQKERQRKDMRPTWEEFSVFYSKAALEFMKRETNREIKEKGKNWKAPVVHLNDSQTALISVYKKIQKNIQDKRARRDPSFRKDPFLEQAITFFTTHTYMNRKEYDEGTAYGENTMKLMGITGTYKELFKRFKKGTWGQTIYDIASAGLRSSDGQGAVSRAHRDDINGLDEWVTSPQSVKLRKLLRKLGVGRVRVKAISNGDNRKTSAVIFRKILKELYPDANVEQPTAEQIIQVKKVAKETLKLSPGMGYFTSGKIREDRRMLDADKIVISYSGRLVPEKTGLKRAFTPDNIRAFLKRGIQVVIYGNLQVQHEKSPLMKKELEDLCEKLKTENLPGKLIFVPRFSLEDQRYLLAATDIQVQDSDEETEAAGYTEADVSACGGLECAPPRMGRGEGLLKEQGILLDPEVPGKGNTLIPGTWSEEGYRKVLCMAAAMGTKRLAPYQATSVRLSRILKAKLTAAAYLREFNKTIRNKAKEQERIKRAQEKEEAEERAGFLVEQIIDKSDQMEYLRYHISRKVLTGNVDGAVMQFFSSGLFQKMKDNLRLPAGIFNNLINAYLKNPEYGGNIRYFCRDLNRKAIELTEDTPADSDVAVDLQIMSGQLLTIMFWIETGTVPGAGGLRLTGDKNKAIKNSKGISFIDRDSLPEGLRATDTEGETGFFWRGKEMYKKLGTSAMEGLVCDKRANEEAIRKLVMYIMDHGFLRVPDKIVNITGKNGGKRVSTLHETYFVNDMVPGSYQTTSTGEGHFQGDSLDIKYATEGKGIQFNVLYNEKGNITKVVAQEIKKGDWFFALPGYVDYVVDMGGLRFSDFSVKLSPKEAGEFNPYMNFNNPELIGAIKDHIDGNEKKGIKKHKIAPYIGAFFDGREYVVNTLEDVSKAEKIGKITEWIYPGRQSRSGTIHESVGNMFTLMQFYGSLSEQKLNDWLKDLGDTIKANLAENRTSKEPRDITLKKRNEMISVIKESAGTNEEIQQMPSLEKATFGTVGGIKKFAEDTEIILGDFLRTKGSGKKLLRIPVETVEAAGKENVKGFLESLEKTGKFRIRFYYSDNDNELREVGDNFYNAMGIEKKPLPENFKEARKNTITLLPVYKNENLKTSQHNEYWQNMQTYSGISPLTSIITPVGKNYDRAAIVRSVFLGLQLSEIARMGKKADSANVSYLKAAYMELCFSQGVKSGKFDISNDDIITLAMSSDFEKVVVAINKIIALLPIMPLNVEEIKEAYDDGQKVVKSA